MLLGAGAVFMALRMLCMVFVHSMAPLILVQLLEAVSYGLFQPAAMEYIGSITPGGNPGDRPERVYTAVQMPAGTILANALAIPLLQAGSVCGMFAVFSALALLGALLLLFSLRYGGGALRKGGTQTVSNSFQKVKMRDVAQQAGFPRSRIPLCQRNRLFVPRNAMQKFNMRSTS